MSKSKGKGKDETTTRQDTRQHSKSDLVHALNILWRERRTLDARWKRRVCVVGIAAGAAGCVVGALVSHLLR